MKRQWILLYFLFLWHFTEAQDLETENVILVTFDGLRWQEVFSGADKKLLKSKKYTHHRKELTAQFWHNDPLERRKRLMPFLWSTIEAEGQLIGNRRWGNKMNLTTKYWRSYPGYNEMLSGRADSKLKKNDKVYNQNVTVLEWINRQPKYRGKVAVVGSWELFPYIINTERSGIPVNGGNEPAIDNSLTKKEKRLNEQLARMQPHWLHARRDKLTFQYALEYMKRERPRLMYLAFGETDEHAHEGNYGEYLKAAYQSDAMIGELWEWLQSQEQYRDKTTLIIATDHGRGMLTKKSWKGHGRIRYPGSNQVWLAIIGPDITPAGELKVRQKYYQYQIAGTIAYFLGLSFSSHRGSEPELLANP